MIDHRCQVDALQSEEEEEIRSAHEDPWHWWNKFRATADFSSKFSIALEISVDIPSKLEISRWMGK